VEAIVPAQAEALGSSRLGGITRLRSRQLIGLSYLLRFWHLNSLDAPTVAVVWTLALAWTFHLRLPIWILATLALGTWSVYIGDRLLDAWRAKSPLRARHYFHWRYRWVFSPAALAAFCIAMALILRYMPMAARGRNSILAVAALAYFTGVHSRSVFAESPPATRHFAVSFPVNFPVKELLVAVIFTLACAAPAWARMVSGHLGLLLPVVCFILLAWLNCHAIEIWEASPKRVRETVPSRRSQTFRLSIALASATLAASGIAFALHMFRPAALLASAALSALALAALDRNRHRLSAITLRAAADLVLLTPLALLVLR
jgi:hypothetical protein